MSMASRKANTQRLLTVLTLVLVLANLVPIVWMVYCSFKDNEEILAGAVAPGRRHNDVVFVKPLADGFLVGTQDGGINRLDRDLKLLQHKNLGTFATSYALQGDTLWVLSSNRGLAAYGVSDFSERAKFSVADIAASVGPAWKTLWVNDVAGSSLVVIPGGLIFTYMAVDFSGVVRMDAAAGTFAFIPSLGRDVTGLVRQMTLADDSTLGVLVAKGYFHFDARTYQLTKTLASPSVLPADASRFAELSGERVAFARGKSALIYDLKGDTTTCALDEEAGLGTSVVSAMDVPHGMQGGAIGAGSDSLAGIRLWLGNSQALHGIGFDSTGACRIVTSRQTLEEGGNSEDVTGAEVTALLTDGKGGQVIGGTHGRLFLLNGEGQLQSRLELPKPPFYFRWRNFVDLWRNIDFGLYLYNSFVVCGSVMVLAMILASLGGYALARYDFPGKNTFGYSVLATQMIPGIMLLLPIYLMYVNIAKHTGLVVKGTYGGLIITYAAYFVPFSIWILRGFFASIPKELEEAALIDGCGPFRAFFQIIIPSAMPGIIATGVYVFLSAWDELMFAWVLTSESTYTIPVGIRLFVGNFQNRYDLMMAAATVSTLPVMLLFFLMQRHIVSGLTAGAVKD